MVVLFTGRSGHGKTTLLERLIVLATALGRRVAVIKHTHHEGPFIRGGGDSGRLLRAGAVESILATEGSAMLEAGGGTGPWTTPDELMRLLPSDLDLIFIEGFRHWEGLPRIGVHRGRESMDLPNDCIAIVSDAAAAADRIPIFRFSELPGILTFIDTINGS